MVWGIILIVLFYYCLGWLIAYSIGKSNGVKTQRENDLTIYLSTGKMQDQDGQLVEYKKPKRKDKGKKNGLQ